MVPLPPLNLSSTTASRSDNAAAFDNSGFVVNQRGGPAWLSLALLALAAFYLLKKG